ncbi:MAG TPA: S8 family serine peptidase, partial [Sedimentisphaerales bacterium]|nr:S8 family serine peptidase [Sedimentisphaerales bacterium]
FFDRGTPPAGVSAHETAIAGILFGRDPNAAFEGLGQFTYEGVIPDAMGNFYEFWYFLTDTVFPMRRPDADVITMSLGSQFEDWWTRGIEAMSERYGIPVVAGIGNGLEAHDSVLFPAAGSNVIGVGVLETILSDDLETNLSQFWLPRPESSSSGPTDDNRAKPDIVAPGRFLTADSTNPDGLLITASGSSYAAPLVAGVIGLLTQEAKSDPNLAMAAGEGAARIMRAILMTSARKMPYWQKGMPGAEDDHIVPLDYAQGAGRLDAIAAYELLKAGRKEAGSMSDSGWDFNSIVLDGADARAYLLDTSGAEGKTITATLVWHRYYQHAYPFARNYARDTDLAMELWAWDDSGSRMVDHSDSRVDNLEHISFVAEPNEQYFLLVRLSGNAAPNSEASESFAMAWRVHETPPRDVAWYDINGDGTADIADAAAIIANFSTAGTKTKVGQPGDINGDGFIDLVDLVLLSRVIGKL